MKPFTFYKIILLLFVFGLNNLYAVQSTATDPLKTESVATIPATKTVKENPRKSKRKLRLIERIKEKFPSIFPKDDAPLSTAQNGDLETKTHGLAIASLVCGILGFFTFGVAAILAIIFGSIAKKKIRESGGFYTGKGMATAGVILGVIPLAILVVALLLFIASSGF